MTARNAKRRSAFTMLELMFVCGIIALVATLVLPTIISIFNAGADSQAYNILASQMSAARALAMRSDTHTAVHVQAPASSLNMTNACYIAVMKRGSNGFALAPGYAPVRVPSGIGFAVLNSATIDMNGMYIAAGLKDPNCTTFTFIYAPSGELVRHVDGEDLVFDSGDAVFTGTSMLWDVTRAHGMGGNGTTGAVACTMFEWGQYTAAWNASSRDTALKAYFDEHGMFLPVNIQTGQLYPRR